MKTKHSTTAYRLAQNELDRQVRENFGQMPRNDPWVDSVLDLRDALEVLAKTDQTEQPEQEPVACIYNGCLYMAWEFQSGKVPHDSCHLYTSSKLKEWMGLTFDEKYDLAHHEPDPYEVVKNVEIKLKEKNHG